MQASRVSNQTLRIAQLQGLTEPLINAHGGYVHLYADIAIATPAQEIVVNGTSINCASPDQSGNLLCTAQQPGDADAEFNIQSTSGFFYPGNIETSTQTPPQNDICQVPNLPPLRRNGGEIANTNTAVGWGGCASQSGYNIVVKEKTISCPITVVDAAGQPPATPKLSANANGACTVGIPHSITMSATDPEGDQIRYAIDWNADVHA